MIRLCPLRARHRAQLVGRSRRFGETCVAYSGNCMRAGREPGYTLVQSVQGRAKA